MKVRLSKKFEFTTSRKKKISIEYSRLGKEGGKNTKEYFFIENIGAFTLEDLKRLAEEAEQALKANQ